MNIQPQLIPSISQQTRRSFSIADVMRRAFSCLRPSCATPVISPAVTRESLLQDPPHPPCGIPTPHQFLNATRSSNDPTDWDQFLRYCLLDSTLHQDVLQNTELHSNGSNTDLNEEIEIFKYNLLMDVVSATHRKHNPAFDKVATDVLVDVLLDANTAEKTKEKVIQSLLETDSKASESTALMAMSEHLFKAIASQKIQPNDLAIIERLFITIASGSNPRNQLNLFERLCQSATCSTASDAFLKMTSTLLLHHMAAQPDTTKSLFTVLCQLAAQPTTSGVFLKITTDLLLQCMANQPDTTETLLRVVCQVAAQPTTSKLFLEMTRDLLHQMAEKPDSIEPMLRVVCQVAAKPTTSPAFLDTKRLLLLHCMAHKPDSIEPMLRVVCQVAAKPDASKAFLEMTSDLLRHMADKSGTNEPFIRVLCEVADQPTTSKAFLEMKRDLFKDIMEFQILFLSVSINNPNGDYKSKSISDRLRVLCQVAAQPDTSPAFLEMTTDLLRQMSDKSDTNETFMRVLCEVAAQPGTSQAFLDKTSDLLRQMAEKPDRIELMLRVVCQVVAQPTTSHAFLKMTTDLLRGLKDKPHTPKPLFSVLCQLANQADTIQPLLLTLRHVVDQSDTSAAFLAMTHDVLRRMVDHSVTNEPFIRSLCEVAAQPGTSQAFLAMTQDVLIGKAGKSQSPTDEPFIRLLCEMAVKPGTSQAFLDIIKLALKKLRPFYNKRFLNIFIDNAFKNGASNDALAILQFSATFFINNPINEQQPIGILSDLIKKAGEVAQGHEWDAYLSWVDNVITMVLTDNRISKPHIRNCFLLYPNAIDRFQMTFLTVMVSEEEQPLLCFLQSTNSGHTKPIVPDASAWATFNETIGPESITLKEWPTLQGLLVKTSAGLTYSWSSIPFLTQSSGLIEPLTNLPLSKHPQSQHEMSIQNGYFIPDTTMMLLIAITNKATTTGIDARRFFEIVYLPSLSPLHRTYIAALKTLIDFSAIPQDGH